jgi:hypothetical protein
MIPESPVGCDEKCKKTQPTISSAFLTLKIRI